MSGSRSEWLLSAAARFGLAARGIVYGVIGWLAIQIARGHGKHEANQRGALAAVRQQPLGTVLLWLLGFGFAAYAFWRLSEAVRGTAADGKKRGPRLEALGGSLTYLALSAATFAFIAGSGSHHGEAQQQASWTARAMNYSAGRWLVGIVGIVVVVIGVAMIVSGFTRRFERELQMNDLSGPTRTIVVRLGMVGTVARGVVFAIAGALVVDAAVTFKPGKSKGLDGALHTLANQPFGPWLLGLVAAGIIAFGVFGLAEARWART